MADVDFKGRVAIVTGAGGGLGREHALEFARRGAKVVVNDLGGSVSGEGASDAAKKVVEEIKSLGGEAIADGGSVTDAAAMTQMAKRALDAFGRIDILVANAGILRDKSFSKMEVADFDAVVATHLLGAARSVKAVWETMRGASYGRIVLTTSAAGLFGNFGQTNYAAAKMGLVGFANALKVEGAKFNIRVNVLSPFAATRMSEDLIAPESQAAMHPRFVAPGVAFLASEDSPNGVILNCGAGVLSVSRMVDSPGVTLDRDKLTAEAIRDNWQRISDASGEQAFESASAFSIALMKKIRL